MTTLSDLVQSYTRTPSATVYLDGRAWRAISKLSFHQKFKENIATGSVEGRDPPTTPRIGMAVRWTWGYNGQEAAGFYGEVSGFTDMSYPDRWTLQCNDMLWRADKSSQVLQTDPLNEIPASDAVRYLLTHYGGIPSSKLSIPTLPASGAAWAGSEWTLGVLTPVQWGDTDTESGGTTALRAAAEICSCLGYWLYADAGGVIRAKQMERKPSTSARETFARNLNLLLSGAPERQQSYENVYNQATVRGANTGVDGAQLYDQYRTSHPLLPSDVYRDFGFSSFLLEYENAADAGAACVTEVAKRILNVVSRIPDVVPLKAKADPNRKVGDTVGITDTGIQLASGKNFFIYQVDRTLDLTSGAFDDGLLLDGGTGNSGFTTVPPPDASFSWTLMAETLDGDAVVEVSLDGSASTSPSGEIVTWAWSTATATYGATPNSATGVKAMFVFLASSSPASITLTVTDTTAKIGAFTAEVDLTGADTQPPFREVISAAAGSAWYVTPDGGATWNIETTNGDSVAVGPIGAGADDRASGTGGTYGLLATRGASGAGGLRQTLDTLATASTNLVSNAGAITSNIWVNESNPARVWFAIGTAVYRSTDGGATKTAMHAAPATVHWIMEDPALDDSVFLVAGADFYVTTDPTASWRLYYPGPVGATARQFVRSRDGQVTWICYTGAPSGQALQRVENGAVADIAVTDIRSLALDRQASNLSATLYAITADNPPQIWSFDGLTGLSAAASSQTFPAGATVQHMLSSRLFDVIYTADFDSIGAGQGALRKYFPILDQLLLWKALAAGEQGTMLGLGSRASAPAEFLRMTHGVDPGGVWHYQGGVWTFRPLPIAGTVRGVAIAADPFHPDRWLAVFNNNTPQCYDSGGVLHGDGWAHSPLWQTEDAGVSWTEVVVTTPAGWVDGSRLNFVTFNDQFGGQWAAVFYSGGAFYSGIVQGTGASVTAVAEDTTYSTVAISGGADGEYVLSTPYATGNTDGVRYLDTENTLHTPSGTPIDDMAVGDRYPGASRAIFYPGSSLGEFGDTDTIYHASDYRAGQPTSLIFVAGVSIRAVTCALSDIYYLDDDQNIYRITDPTSSAIATLVGNTGGSIGAGTYPRVDRQTRTVMGVASNADVITDDGTTTTRIAGPSVSGLLSNIGDGCFAAFETIVRT